MVEVRIKITDGLARKWQVALTNALNRRRGQKGKRQLKIKLEKLCEIALYDAVAREFSAQLDESIASAKVAEREYSAWLQSECDKAVSTLHNRRARLAGADCKGETMTPLPASSPPDTPRHVIGFFADQRGSSLVWNWEPVFYSENERFLSVEDHEDYTDAIQFWTDVAFPEQEPTR